MAKVELNKPTAVNAPTRFIEVGSRRLAYRMIGDGAPLILCLRLRGVMDVWDPAFLDALAEHFTVITFDYSGLGQSTGTPSYDRAALARDAKDLADGLRLDRVVIGGWSLGGVAAQVFTALYPERTSHAILIGTVPPGAQPYHAEPIFLPTALKPDYTLEDEYVLFFEPESKARRAAGKASHARIAARTADLSPPIPQETYLRIVRESHDEQAVFPDNAGYAHFLASTSIPMLAICGDHDIVFPVENWYALNRKWKSLHIITFPQAGHGPQHQFPAVCADVIASFVRNVR
jgi:pimeloyl-ACP methyl ester carboxylesterase